MKILVVEDELIIQLDIRIELEDNGFEVFTADNSTDAIDIVKNNDVECIIMDINIKGDKNGIETTEMIRKSRTFRLFSVLQTTICLIAKNILTSLKNHST